jgi:hypothetical protein
MPRCGALHSSVSWDMRNAVADVARPIDVEVPDLPPGHLPIGVSHTIGGNPTRPEGTSVPVQPDER